MGRTQGSNTDTPATGSELTRARLGAPLDVMVPALHTLIGTEMTAAVCFETNGGRLDVQAARCVNVPADADLVRRCHVLVQSLCDGLEGVMLEAPLGLRNKVLVEAPLDPSHHGPFKAGFSLPIDAGGGQRQITLMICERSTPLAWIGGWQTQNFDGHQRRLLASLTDPLRRWLLEERTTAARTGIDPPGTVAFQRARPTAVGAATGQWRLTPRQRDVLELLARGVTNAVIADELNIAERTVEFHVTAIFDKAGVDNRTALLARLFT